MLKVNNKDARTTPGVFIVNFKHISHLVLVFLLLTCIVNYLCCMKGIEKEHVISFQKSLPLKDVMI